MKLKKLLFFIFPYLSIFLLVSILFLTNVKKNTYFSGWDNLHPEFNFAEYAKRIVFGAWVEHQGLGAPAAQSQLSELSRLPIIFFLSIFLPKNLIRYIFHFLMLFLGAVGMFLFLKKMWVKDENIIRKKFLSLFGAFYYLLNIFTLQQFYISFELFAVQFAFLPFNLITIYNFINSKTKKNFILLIISQFLFTPTAHTPTVFYISFIFFLLFAFFIIWEKYKNLTLFLKNGLSFSLIIFFVHSYWIIPNIYYILFKSNYVTESRANYLFNQESKWSVIEAGDIKSLISGVHYLFTWKDFNFNTRKYELIFKEWINHFSNPLILFFLIIFNIFSLFGIFYTLIKKEIGKIRFSILIFHVFALIFLWSGLFLPTKLINFFYASSIIKESFRNPFTKLQIVFSFTTTLLLITTIEFIGKKIHKALAYWLSGFLFILLTITYYPSFKGQFINEKLKTNIPQEYFEAYDFFQKQDKDLRVLELPFLSDAGWVYYDWGRKGNYQGIGINFFGIPQPYLTPDFARWEETNDFFYHELRYALNNKDASHLKDIFMKYNIDLILVDENLNIEKKHQFDFNLLIALLRKTGAYPVWQKNKLSVFYFSDDNTHEKFAPKKIYLINQDDIKRVKKDVVFEKHGDYITCDKECGLYYPLTSLYTFYPKDSLSIEKNQTNLRKKINEKKFILDLYEYNKQLVNNPLPYYVYFNDFFIEFKFPQIRLSIDKKIILDQLFYKNLKINLEKKFDSFLITDSQKITRLVKKNQFFFGVLYPKSDIKFTLQGINYDKKDKSIFYPEEKLTEVKISIINQDLNEEYYIKEAGELQIQIFFPTINFDLKNISENCSEEKVGEIETNYKDNQVIYKAKNYGVNCNSLKENYLMFPDLPYIYQIKGKNYLGRSIKFFFNYNQSNTLVEDFIMPEGYFNSTVSFLPVKKTQNNSSPTLNWETRSFGKISINELQTIKAAFFPIDALAKIKIRKHQFESELLNQIEIKKINNLFGFLYLFKVNCKENCFISNNQSFDKLWVAVDNNLSLLPQYKLNNWSNLWQVHQNTTNIIVFYVPEIVSLLFLIFISIYLIKIFIF